MTLDQQRQAPAEDLSFVTTERAVREAVDGATPAPPAPARASLADRERTLLLGLAMLAAGLALAWPPLGLIVPGAIITVLGVISLLGSGER